MSALLLGSIEFINSLPVDFGFLSGQIPMEAQIRIDSPNHLNEALQCGQLDISPVSALWYAQHAGEFLLLPELSISSESSVDSVLLFSNRPIEELKGCPIGVTAKGRTTPVLLEILCRERYGFAPQCHLLETKPGISSTQPHAVLLIGDEALVFKERLSRQQCFVTDLAEEWRSWTGLAFVFAVWVVRRDYFLSNAERVHEIHEKILKSKKWGLDHMDLVLDEARRRTGLSQVVLSRYFSKLSFDFDENLKNGLRHYLELARKLGFLKTIQEFDELPVIADSQVSSALTGNDQKGLRI